MPPILPPQDGYLFLDKAKFRAAFAANVDSEKAFMADSQVPWGLDALNGAVGAPAWKTKPSWYLVASDDHMIPPPAQRFMVERAGATVVEEQAVMPSTSPARRRWPKLSKLLSRGSQQQPVSRPLRGGWLGASRERPQASTGAPLDRSSCAWWAGAAGPSPP